MNAPMTRAYSYRRFSTPEQAHGDSLRRQTQMAEDYCKRNGLTLDTDLDLTDAGISAYAAKNLETDAKLGAFLQLVKSGDIPAGSVLLIENLDRMSRQPPRKALRVLEDIIESGVEVVTLADGVRWTLDKLDGPELFAAIAVMMRAHDESKQKSRRVKAAWTGKREKASTGQLLTHIVPAWIDVDASGKRTLNDKAKTVRLVFDWYARGVGKASISHRLNADKVESFGRGKLAGRGWSKSYVDKLLRGGAAMGTLETGDKSIPDYYPAAVSAQLWQRVQDRVKLERGRRNYTTTGLPIMNVLAGLGRCAACGSPLTRLAPGRKNIGRRPYLVCAKHRAQGDAGCTNKARTALPDIEQALRNLAHSPPPSSTQGLDMQVLDARVRCDNLQHTVNELIDSIERHSSEALSKRLEQRQAALAEAQALLAGLEQKQAVANKRAVARNYDAFVSATKAKSWDTAAVNTALKSLVSRIVVDTKRGVLIVSWLHNGDTTYPYRIEEPKRIASEEFTTP